LLGAVSVYQNSLQREAIGGGSLFKCNRLIRD
jgi:hypothetical protein